MLVFFSKTLWMPSFMPLKKFFLSFRIFQMCLTHLLGEVWMGGGWPPIPLVLLLPISLGVESRDYLSYFLRKLGVRGWFSDPLPLLFEPNLFDSTSRGYLSFLLGGMGLRWWPSDSLPLLFEPNYLDLKSRGYWFFQRCITHLLGGVWMGGLSPIPLVPLLPISVGVESTGYLYLLLRKMGVRGWSPIPLVPPLPTYVGVESTGYLFLLLRRVRMGDLFPYPLLLCKPCQFNLAWSFGNVYPGGGYGWGIVGVGGFIGWPPNPFGSWSFICGQYVFSKILVLPHSSSIFKKSGMMLWWLLMTFGDVIISDTVIGKTMCMGWYDSCP